MREVWLKPVSKKAIAAFIIFHVILIAVNIPW